MATYVRKKPLVIIKEDNILPRLAILTTIQAGWHGISLAYYVLNCLCIS